MTDDFDLADHGSICLLTPLTPAAQVWADEHLPEDATRWGLSIVIEPRYVGAILVNIAEEGGMSTNIRTCK